MNNMLRSFLILNLLVTLLIACAGVIMFAYFLQDYYHPLYPVLLLIALSVNLLSFYLSSKTQVSGNQILNAVVKSFAIRFFLYLGIAITFLLLEDQTKQRAVFIITLFCLYLIYFSIEITSLLKMMKSKK